MRTITTVLVLTLASCMGAAPADPEPSDPNDTAMQAEEQQLDQTQHLLVRVKVSHGREVAFREPQPGQLLITQIGHNGVAPLDLAGDPLETFRSLAPDVEVPSVLANAVARANGAADTMLPTLDQAVVVDEREADSKTAYDFPQSAFSCWVKNRVRCQYYQSHIADSDFNHLVNPFPQQQFNAVWAATDDYVSTVITVWTQANRFGNADTYSYELYNGWWRTFVVSGKIGVITNTQAYNNALFHYSTASGPQ